jgi:hypothetical protein
MRKYEKKDILGSKYCILQYFAGWSCYRAIALFIDRSIDHHPHHHHRIQSVSHAFIDSFPLTTRK